MTDPRVGDAVRALWQARAYVVNSMVTWRARANEGRGEVDQEFCQVMANLAERDLQQIDRVLKNAA